MEKILDFYLKKDEFILDINVVEHPSSGIILISGPSGSGKTSFMRSLAGLEERDADFKWSYKFDKKAFHFQDIKIFPGLTTLENLTLVEADEKKALIYLTKLGLIDKQNEEASSLSGGELQRLGFLRAFMNQADLIFLDEPFGQVNLELREKMYNFLYEVKEERLIFVSTHIGGELKHDFEIKIS